MTTRPMVGDTVVFTRDVAAMVCDRCLGKE